MPTFTLHIQDGTDGIHAIPASVLVQIIENAQRAIELIGLHVEGREIKERARIPAATSRKFQLICQVPQNGSYMLPISVGDPTVDPLAEQQISQAWGIFKQTVLDVYHRQPDALRSSLPDTTFRKRVLEAVKGMAPRAGANWRLEFLAADATNFAAFDTHTGAFIQETMFPAQEREAAQTITGELRSIDFAARKISIIYPVNNKILDCYYDESLEDLLYENRRRMIQVTGRVVLDNAGQPKEILEVSDIRDLDVSAFEIDRVKAGNIALRAKAKLLIEPTLDDTKQLLCLDHDTLGILVYGSTREQLLDELQEQIAMLWSEYAQADDAALTPDALALKRALRTAFEETADAA